MEVIGYDIKPCLESSIKFVSKKEVLTKADYVSIHTGGSEVIVGEKELELMKPTAYLINTSRGANVDEQALYKALKEKKIGGAALDVFAEEPKAEGVEKKIN
jgi:D-3-phosphoglycerate dehydrogenase